ncbi:MAG: hypothetical protein VB102_00645 [Paludibacter sp.]|nr:hypothetical protein [Paludibacter sp.]
MEQKDYLLREIEKIGLIIRAIRQRLFGGKDSFAVNIEQQVEAEKGMLFRELNFDLDKFLLLDVEETNNYLNKFEGFNVENIEHLAEVIFQIGFNENFNKSRIYLEKALRLYELVNRKSKTYSTEREKKIITIQNVLNLR